jgi:hypothetical protein
MKFSTTSSLLLAATLVLGFSSVAQAAYVDTISPTISYTLGGSTVAGTDVNLQALPSNPNKIYSYYNLPGVGKLDLDNAAIVTGTNTSGTLQYKAPTGLSNTDHYLSVYGASSLSNNKSGAAILNLNPGFNTVSFEWGTIDTYNSITIVDDKNKSTTITGAQLLSDVSSLVAGVSSDYFSFTDLAGIKEIILSSTQNSFEIAKMTVSSVPLPAALPLFGAALAGLAVVRRRKQVKAV